MYSAKADGRNNFRFFTENMNAQAVERLTLESSLRSALAREQLFLMYQPQMDIATGERHYRIGKALPPLATPGIGPCCHRTGSYELLKNSGLIGFDWEGWVLRTGLPSGGGACKIGFSLR